MKLKKINYLIILITVLLIQFDFKAQEKREDIFGKTDMGWISLGSRTTVSNFDHDGTGLGTGGQFRIHHSNRISTDWYADYITIRDNNLRSEYIHIGWSVLYYPIKDRLFPKVINPYVLAGHCFDYNKKSLLDNDDISKDRWGSAIQAGLGIHMNLSYRIDLSLTSQYMIHLTESINLNDPLEHNIEGHEGHSTLEGHLLNTLSLNYKLFQL